MINSSIKAFIVVAKYQDLMAIVSTSDAETAKKLAKEHFDDFEDKCIDIRQLEAYTVDEYFNPGEIVTVKFEIARRLTDVQKAALGALETVGVISQVIMEDDGTLKVLWEDGECNTKDYYIDSDGGVK